MGWKQTLYTAFEERRLRIDTFKNTIMKYEVDDCRNQILFNVLIENDRENYLMLTKVWEIGVSSFNGLEINFKNVFNYLNMIKKVLVNNQSILVKKSMAQINFLNKIDERLQNGFRMIIVRINGGL
jgi:hypothetical protein